MAGATSGCSDDSMTVQIPRQGMRTMYLKHDMSLWRPRSSARQASPRNPSMATGTSGLAPGDDSECAVELLDGDREEACR